MAPRLLMINSDSGIFCIGKSLVNKDKKNEEGEAGIKMNGVKKTSVYIILIGDLEVLNYETFT